MQSLAASNSRQEAGLADQKQYDDPFGRASWRLAERQQGAAIAKLNAGGRQRRFGSEGSTFLEPEGSFTRVMPASGLWETTMA